MGQYFKANGEKYVGGWLNGKKSGKGIVIYKDASKFVGQYRAGKRNGHGVFMYSNGDKYFGTFVDSYAQG